MKQKYALVLSGGGFKGAFQLGALNYLQKNWQKISGQSGPMHFDLIAGVSVGALNGALLAQNELEQLNQLWDEIAHNGVEEVYTSDFIETTPGTEELNLKLDLERLKARFMPNFTVKVGLLKGLGLMLSKKKRSTFLQQLAEEAAAEVSQNLGKLRSLADNSPLHRKLQQYLDREKITDTEYYAGFVSLDDGRYHAVPHYRYRSNEDYIKGVLASTAIPIVWDPIADIQLDKETIRQSVDGGIRNNAPFGDLIKIINELDETDTEYTFIVINCNTGEVPMEDYNQQGIAKIALRSLSEIAQSEIFNNDLSEFLRVNDLVDQAHKYDPNLCMKHFNAKSGRRTNKTLRRFRALVIKPEDGVLGNMLTISPQLFAKRHEHGANRAALALAQHLQEDKLVTVRDTVQT